MLSARSTAYILVDFAQCSLWFASHFTFLYFKFVLHSFPFFKEYVSIYFLLLGLTPLANRITGGFGKTTG